MVDLLDSVSKKRFAAHQVEVPAASHVSEAVKMRMRTPHSSVPEERLSFESMCSFVVRRPRPRPTGCESSVRVSDTYELASKEPVAVVSVNVDGVEIET